MTGCRFRIGRKGNMKKLIIITGISGTGKTTLSKMLHKKINESTLLSYDTLSENIYDIVGFRNKKEKKSLQSLNIEIYKKLIRECMKRKDEVIILERPFKKEWIDFFDNLSKQYAYEIYTINVFAKDFKVIWERLLQREKSKKERHPSHYLNSYYLKKKQEYEPFFEYDYDTLKEEYDGLISNRINLGKIIEIQDIEKVNIDGLMEEII